MNRALFCLSWKSVMTNIKCTFTKADNLKYAEIYSKVKYTKIYKVVCVTLNTQ